MREQDSGGCPSCAERVCTQWELCVPERCLLPTSRSGWGHGTVTPDLVSEQRPRGMPCESQWLYYLLLDPSLSSPALPCERHPTGLALPKAEILSPWISLCSGQTGFPHLVKPPNTYRIPAEGKLPVSLLAKSLPSLLLSTPPGPPG